MTFGRYFGIFVENGIFPKTYLIWAKEKFLFEKWSKDFTSKLDEKTSSVRKWLILTPFCLPFVVFYQSNEWMLLRSAKFELRFVEYDHGYL